VQPRATLEHTFDTAASVSGGHAAYDILYRTFETGGTSSITAAASLLDRLLDVNGSLNVDGLWRARFVDPAGSSTSLTPAVWQGLLQRDLQQDRLVLRSALQTAVKPFPALTALSGSTLQYRLGLRLYQLSYSFANPANPVLGEAGVSWTPDSITEHSLMSSLALSTADTTDSLTLTAQLPPLVPTVSARADLAAGALKGRLQGGFSQVAGIPRYQPLVLSGTLDFGRPLTATEELQLDLGKTVIDRSSSQVAIGGFTAAFMAQRMLPVDPRGNVLSGGVEALLPSTLRVGYETVANPLWLWRDRIKLDTSVRTHWYLNLAKYTDNLLDFSLTLTLSIHKALDFSFSSVSTNGKTYRYVPGLPEAVGETWVNPLLDLLWSYNFFNPSDRSRSAFKIRSLSVKAVQHLPDWDLTFQYQGSPQLRADPSDGNRLKYMWTPTISIQVQWVAVPEVKSSVRGDVNGVTLR
jgi:hypothetical protein